jgi:plastocyanin
MKKYLHLLLLSLLTVPTSGFAGDSSIIIKNFKYSPAVVTIGVGSKVTWTNFDEEPHTVSDTSKAQLFRSKVLDTKDQYSHTFTSPGEYEYFCTIHPMMRGRIIVKPEFNNP